MTSYVKLVKVQEAPVEEIKAGELNQPVRVPELEVRKCIGCGQHLPPTYTTPTDEAWTTGIFGCAEDLESCKIGLFCPCILYGKNVETINGTPWKNACAWHATCLGINLTMLASILFCHGFMTKDTLVFMIEGLVCCWNIFTTNTGDFRSTLEKKFHLQSYCMEPFTHFLLHSCAICQEHREMKKRIIEKIGNSNTVTNPPPIQEMSSRVNNQPSSST